MRYIACSEEEKKAMLESIGLSSIEQLFASIPAELRLKGKLDLPPPLSEWELLRSFKSLAAANLSAADHALFLGAGAYNHFIPVVVSSLASRSEFYTAYTPYQPEISQGTLQAMFEFQTMICQLTGMEVANASMYDGSTALAEAVLMALRLKGERRVLTSSAVHPQYREVLATYTKNIGIGIDPIAYDKKTGQTDLDMLRRLLDGGVAAVVVQSPNFFGTIEEIERIGELAHSAGALLVVVVAEAISLGLLRPPGEQGADIVVGEGQSLGIPISFGGPYFGFFATRDEFKRAMPGRIAGRALDADGNPGFVLTLAAREQHIRREKATSNICTNQALCALMATIYLSIMGKQGMREVALRNLHKAEYAAARITAGGRYRLRFSGPKFNEFVISCPQDPALINRRLIEHKIIGGLPLGRFYPELEGSMLLCATEQNSREEIDRLAELLEELA